MKINGTQLDTEAGLIKARSGSYGNGLFRYSKDDYAIYAGGLKFPLAPLNKFTPDMNGVCKLLDGKFTIALDYMLHTPNVISFEVDANITEGQQASYTIQHGGNSTVMDNLTQQKVIMPYEAGKPVTIRAINYATGAIASRTVNPVAGQAYKLASVSSTRVEGELKTVGGETVGEVKNVCMRWENDVESAPTIWSGTVSWQMVIARKSAVDRDSNEDARIDARNLMIDLQAATGSDTLGEWRTDKVPTVLDSRYFLQDQTDLLKRYEVLVGVPISVPDGSYKLVREKGFIVNTYTADGLINATVNVANNRPIAGPTIEISESDALIIMVEVWKDEIPTFTTAPKVLGSTTGPYNGAARISASIHHKVIIKGPVQKFCADWQTIDNRYTVPIVTTDTRRTIHEIILTVTPLN